MEVKSHTNNSQNSDPEFENDPAIINNYVLLHRSGSAINVKLSNEWFYSQLHRFIAALATQYYGGYMASQGDDLLQSGWLGVMDAIDSYDPYQYAITTHFKPYILCRMRACLNDDSVKFHSFHKVVAQVRNALDENEGLISAKAIAEKTGLSLARVNNVLNYLDIKQSVDFAEVSEFVSDNDESVYPEQVLLQQEWFTTFYDELKRILTPTEYEQVCVRFGLSSTADSFDSSVTQFSTRGRLPTVLLQKLKSSNVLKELAAHKL